MCVYPSRFWNIAYNYLFQFAFIEIGVQELLFLRVFFSSIIGRVIILYVVVSVTLDLPQ